MVGAGRAVSSTVSTRRNGQRCESSKRTCSENTPKPIIDAAAPLYMLGSERTDYLTTEAGGRIRSRLFDLALKLVDVGSARNSKGYTSVKRRRSILQYSQLKKNR